MATDQPPPRTLRVERHSSIVVRREWDLNGDVVNIWLGDDAVNLEVAPDRDYDTVEEADRDTAPTLSLPPDVAERLVAKLLRGPMGPPGAMGPTGAKGEPA